MGTLSGQVTIDGVEVAGAEVVIVDTAGSSDPAEWSVAGGTTTESNGSWSVSGLDGGTDRYHAMVQFEDGGQLYHAESLPFLTVMEVSPDPAGLSVEPIAPSFSGVIPDGLVYNAEENSVDVVPDNWTGFAGDTSKLSAQDSTVLAGDYSGELTSGSASDGTVTATRDNPNQPEEVSYLVQGANQNGGSTDGIYFQIGSGSDRLGVFRLDGTGAIEMGFVETGASWSTGTTYRCRFFNIDFGSETFDWEVVEVATESVAASGTDEPFSNSLSSVDTITVRSNTTGNGGSITQYFDDIIWNPE